MAMVVCLGLSAVTTDSSCIQGTIHLKKAGYLDPKRLSEATWEEVYPYVQQCGIGEPTAKNLVLMAKQLMDRHDGKVPSTYIELHALAGIAGKGTAILVNEIFGLVETIAVDRHVEDIATSLYYFFRAAWLKKSAAVDRKHVEMSLRTWVPMRKSVYLLRGGTSKF